MIPILQRFLGSQPVTKEAKPRRVSPVGTGDSPVLPGQKPGAFAVKPKVQPRKRRALGWWQIAFAKAQQDRSIPKTKIETAEKDLNRKLGSVTGDEFSDVVATEAMETNQNGRQTKQPPESRQPPLVKAFVSFGHLKFPVGPMRFWGVAEQTRPVVDRSRVAPAIEALPVVVYENVQKNYA